MRTVNRPPAQELQAQASALVGDKSQDSLDAFCFLARKSATTNRLLDIADRRCHA
jgi:hypothetical protein